MASLPPTLDWELELAAAGYTLIAGCDEVGRGALAGPVSVGVVAINPLLAGPIEGVKDSKLLKEATRIKLVPEIKEWAAASGVGHATAAEIDEKGLVAALRLAGTRALAQIALTLTPDLVILDGNQDWLSVPQQAELDFGLFDASAPEEAGAAMTVKTRIKADMTCLSVAAASVLAKVERDTMMAQYSHLHPEFDWAGNKGYATAGHRAAIAANGPSDFHRKTWRLI